MKLKKVMAIFSHVSVLVDILSANSGVAKGGMGTCPPPPPDPTGALPQCPWTPLGDFRPPDPLFCPP